jgi:uncharacterized membrane protein YiaA
MKGRGAMTVSGVFQFLLGVSRVVWGLWNATVQLERLNKD